MFWSIITYVHFTNIRYKNRGWNDDYDEYTCTDGVKITCNFDTVGASVKID